MSAEQLKVNNLRRSSITEQKSRHCLDFLDVTIYNYHILLSFLARAAIWLILWRILRYSPI